MLVMLILCFTLLRTARPYCRERWCALSPYLWLGMGKSWWRMSVLCLQQRQRSSACQSTRGEKGCMRAAGLCASWVGVSLRVVLGVFHSPAMRRTTKTQQNLLLQPLAYTHSLAVTYDRLVGCGLMKGRVIHLCYCTQKSLSGVSMLTGIMMQCLIKS